MNRTIVGAIMIVLMGLSVSALGQEDTSHIPQQHRKRLLVRRAKPADLPKKIGWWIRLDTTKTKAKSVSFAIGTKKGDILHWRSWNHSEIHQFDVPDSLLQKDKIFLEASSEPRNQVSSFCVFYIDEGVRHFEFVGTESHEINRKSHDPKCK